MGFITEDELDNVGDSGIGASLPTNSNQFGGRFIDESMLDSSNVQNTSPTWGESAKFVGKSLAQGAAKTLDFIDNVFHPGRNELLSNNAQKLVNQYIGTPGDMGIGGTPAKIIDAAVQGSVFPVGGPVANAVASAGSEIAHQMFPDSFIAPIAGAVVSGLGVDGVKALSNSFISGGKAFERASIGAKAKDYVKDLKIRGLADDIETSELSTKLANAINEIGDTEGFGLLRDPQRLAARNSDQLQQLGGKIGAIISKADELNVPATVSFSDASSKTAQLINAAKAEKGPLKEALSEFTSKFYDPVDGWDNTLSGLNAWKSSVGETAFSGTAKGTLKPAVARKLQRAIYADLANGVESSVTQSGLIDPKDWKDLLKTYSNHATIAPILNPEFASSLSNTWDKTARGLLRTSGGTLTTPTLIAGALGTGAGGAAVGLTAGGALALVGSPTGQGIVGNILKKTGRLGAAISKDAKTAPLAALVTNDSIPNIFNLQNKAIFNYGNKAMETTDKARTEDSNLDQDFYKKVDKIALDLEADPEHLLQVMKFETGGSLDPAQKNRAGSGATGLIQFMPSTAQELTGADTKAAAIKILESMTPTEQLDYVKKYLAPFKGKLNSLDDLYMAILFPKAVGRDPEYVLFKDGTKAYWQNRGLDLDKDGLITKMEAASKVKRFEA